jgi:hypothetical protein
MFDPLHPRLYDRVRRPGHLRREISLGVSPVLFDQHLDLAPDEAQRVALLELCGQPLEAVQPFLLETSGEVRQGRRIRATPARIGEDMDAGEADAAADFERAFELGVRLAR